MPYVRPEPTSTNFLHAPCKHAKIYVRRVGILVFDGFSLIDAGLVAEVFHIANQIFRTRSGNDNFYDVRFLSSYGGNIACSSSILIWTDGIEGCRELGFNVLFIASGIEAHNTAGTMPPPFWLHAVYPKTTILTESAEGHASLAAAAPLQNHESRRRLHSCEVPSAKELGRHGEALSDALLVVRKDLGQGISSDVAESLTANWKGRLVQPPNDDSDHSVADRMRNAARWLHENFERPISVADVARIASMSERHFLRCFKLQMGSLPSDYLFQVRLSMATRLLTETELPVDKIARRSGFSNGDRLAKIFRKRLSVSPIEFRNHSRC